VEVGQRPLRVVVQEQRRLLREGLAALLAAEDDILVVAAVEVADDVADVAGQVDVVVCGDWCEPTSSARMLRLRDEDPGQLISRLRRLDLDGPDAHDRVPLREFTPREAQIMREVADGMSTGQIGTLLGISPKTVENCKQRVFVKLGVQSQGHAVVVAHQAGLLRRGECST
jgi:DNA-binding NarL/FixJ family response regulator